MNRLRELVAAHRETILIAFQSLGEHKLRSILTMLGIVFGVGAVISMLSIGEGARQEALEQIEALGVHNIIIRSSIVEDRAADEEDNTPRPIGVSLKDAEAISQVCPFINAVSVSWESEMPMRTYEGRRTGVVIGATPDFRKLFNIRLSNGSFFSSLQVEDVAPVCVIGSEVRTALFGFSDPTGKMMKIDDQWFTVIGVMQPKKSGVTGGVAIPELNDAVVMPLATAMSRFSRTGDEDQPGLSRRRRRFSEPASIDRNTVDQIAVQVRSDIDIGRAAEIITEVLTRRHNGWEDFTVTIPEQLIEQSQKTQSIFNIVMGAIAGISLLVGGIGIMNIMLASVLERTREIGIRRAIGATRTTVIIQFLAEAAMLSLIGGVIGIALGWAMTGVITVYAGWRTIVSFWSIILAFTVAVATGIIFGWFPARQAAEKDVIESLRYE